MAQRLLLARHGSVGPGYRGRYVGATDPTLDDEGRRQADALAAALADREVGVALCSPLRRARETADAIAERTGLAVEVDPDLREIDFGRWEGKTFDEIQAADAEAVERWAAFAPDFAFPGGERLSEFLARIERVAGRVAKHEAGSVLLVTHGGVIRALICHLLGLSPQSYVLFEIGRASISTVQLFGERGVLAELNNCSHLPSAI